MMQNLSIKDDGISFITPLKRSLLVSGIEEQYHSHIRALGHYVLVKPYVRPDNIDGVYIDDSTRSEDGHHSTVSQVIDIGPAAYADEKYSGGLIWAEIGDFVIIPRVAGTRIVRKIGKEEVMFRIVKEDDIIALINDPTEWEIRVSATRF